MKGEVIMKVLIGALLFVVANAIAIIYRRKCQDNAGWHIGKKHMREDWGIDDKELYHE